MEKRTEGLTEIYDRLKPLFVSYPLTFLDISPDFKVEAISIPAVIIIEGTDEIQKRTQRTYLGYPAKRQLEVIIECWDNTLDAVRSLYQEARSAVLANSGILIPDEVIIREDKVIGPFNLDIPNIKGMRIIFLMTYEDAGVNTS